MRGKLGICGLLAGMLVWSGAAFGQQQIPPRPSAYDTAPDIPYTSVPNFIKLPTGLYLGEGIARSFQFQGTLFRIHAQRAHASV